MSLSKQIHSSAPRRVPAGKRKLRQRFQSRAFTGGIRGLTIFAPVGTFLWGKGAFQKFPRKTAYITGRKKLPLSLPKNFGWVHTGVTWPKTGLRVWATGSSENQPCGGKLFYGEPRPKFQVYIIGPGRNIRNIGTTKEGARKNNMGKEVPLGM